GALALKVFMGLDAQRDVEVAGRAATWRHLALASDPHVDAIVHPSWNIDCHPAHVAHAPLSLATLAGRGNDTAFTPAAVADHDVDELPKDGLLDAPDFAGALAGGAPRGVGARLRAIAAAGRAGLPAWDLDIFLATLDGLLK